jgi:hypothetical protein
VYSGNLTTYRERCVCCDRPVCVQVMVLTTYRVNQTDVLAVTRCVQVMVLFAHRNEVRT